MKILYGIQGTGNGHITRARALVPELRKAGIDIDFIFSGRAREDFFNLHDIFGDDFRCFSGLSLITEKGRLNTFKTVTQNHFAEFIRDVKNLDLDSYNLVLSDFEPVTAWAAKLQGKTSMGISHQCAFLHDVPKVNGYYAAKLLMRIFAPTQISIGLHWHHFNQPILPPLIEPHQRKPVISNKIVVYMGFEETIDIINLLQPYTKYRFIIYAKVPEVENLGHITLKPLSTEFHRDIEDASGVISNAGFELASECLYLGKKLLVKPLLGQYEQLSNALALEALGKGSVMHSLDKNILGTWLEQAPQTAIDYPDTAQHLAQWLASGDWHNSADLVSELWKGIHKPV
jgi:uncharacterized protein (TIGR00661 family)